MLSSEGLRWMIDAEPHDRILGNHVKGCDGILGKHVKGQALYI